MLPESPIQKHNYRELPREELMHWMRLKYVDKIPTVELVKRAHTPIEREEVALVSLLDLDDSSLQESMPSDELEARGVLPWILEARQYMKPE